jgi:rod shape-determining protein MreC
LILGIYQSSAKAAAKVDWVSLGAKQLTHYPMLVLRNVGDWASDFTSGIFQANALSSRVRELDAAARAYRASRAAIAGLEADLAETRALARLPNYPTFKKVAADIIGYFPDAHRILLNVGSARMVKAGAPVLVGGGLVGQVVEVSGGASYVNLLTNADFSVGARVQHKKPSEAGIAAGQASEYLLLSVYTEQAVIEPGDELTTSGLSSIYPEGISLGRADKVWQNKNFGIQEASIVPTVNVRKIRHVVVLVR